VRGIVQGVGFRPFVYRLATSLNLAGWVLNSSHGVLIEVEGSPDTLRQFLLRLEAERPPRCAIHGIESMWLDPSGHSGFEIQASQASNDFAIPVSPDIATCHDCLREIFNPCNRRYLYPFTNCTNCGPRFTIVECMPYDRPNTSMKSFPMCPACRAEYENPQDRRFHAQPNACPVCGPRLEIWDRLGNPLSSASPLSDGVRALREGLVVAVKGLGGFHLMVDACNEPAIQKLRRIKNREEKPFALMFPNLDMVKASCLVSPIEEQRLASPEAPIVLLPRLRGDDHLAPAVAPGNPFLGVMLPYTPLHHLLLAEMRRPVVATSGNLSDETICTDEFEAAQRLGGFTDFFLVHNRPIVRPVDDSIVRLIAGREMVLRRARGYAPLPVSVPGSTGTPNVLAVGAHKKNTVAVAKGPEVFLSQHIGDLDTPQSYDAFKNVISDLINVFEVPPQIVVADSHPDYLSTHHARRLAKMGSSLQYHEVQHHLAHVLSCMAENELRPPVLGVAWDGTGYGPDGVIWGGEFFVVNNHGARRFSHFRPFPLPGGERAVREPRRAALGMLFAHFGSRTFRLDYLPTVKAFLPSELVNLESMLKRQFNTPHTTSVGRIFDAVASLSSVCQEMHFEGQAAMKLEFAAAQAAQQSAQHAYEIQLVNPKQNDQPFVLDWGSLLNALLSDIQNGVEAALLAARFHSALVQAILAVSHKAGIERVVLSGGCFQNRLLTEATISTLQGNGFRPYWHQRVPPNDGGISLGQVMGIRSGVQLHIV